MKQPLVALLLIMQVPGYGQLFVTLEPQFLRPGVVYSPKTDHRIGVYVKAWYGDIYSKDEIGNTFYTENVKTGAGITIQAKDDTRDRFVTHTAKWYVGLNYNYFFNTHENKQLVNLDRVHPISLDLGLSLTVKRFSMLMMTDPLNWESCIGVSYRLRREPCVNTAYDKRHRTYKQTKCKTRWKKD